jgi:hypothetical protein
MDAKGIFIGMDLGTFKTSVASSAGVRDVIPTAVGWPKDSVARTMLGGGGSQLKGPAASGH